MDAIGGDGIGMAVRNAVAEQYVAGHVRIVGGVSGGKEAS